MLKTTENISSKYPSDMFILCVKTFKKQKGTVWNSNQEKFFCEFITVTFYLEIDWFLYDTSFYCKEFPNRH